MITLLRLLAPVCAALLASACGASSGNDYGNGRLQSNTAATAQPTGDASATSADQANFRKVALKLGSMSDPSNKAYRIGPLDVLDITVFKVPELSKTVQVSETGTFGYPLIGEVEAGGKTAREIEKNLTKTLGDKYLQNPQITVFVKEHNSQRVTVEGAVKKPGVIPMAGGLTLLQAIAQAQGSADNAESTAVVFRQVDGQRTAARYDLESIRTGRATDPQLEANDVIIVPVSDVKEGINYVVKFLPLATAVPYL